MRITFFAMTAVSIILLVSATVWEGVTEVASAGDLQGNYSVATNSFPRNTVVDITNLENGKMVRVKVVAGLESSGLLAMLSRTAAESIDLRGNSGGRIRMTQPSDDIAFSLFHLGPISSPASHAAASRAAAPRVAEFDTRTEGFAVKDTAGADNNAGTSGKEQFAGVGQGVNGSPQANGSQQFTGTWQGANGSPQANGSQQSAAGRVTAGSANPTAATGVTVFGADNSTAAYVPVNPPISVTSGTPAETAAYYREPGTMYGRLSLIPTDERIPTSADRYVISPEDIIPSIEAAVASQQAAQQAMWPEAEYVSPIEYASIEAMVAVQEPEIEYIPPVEFSPVVVVVRPEAENIPSAEFSPFQAPLISRLEPNKWYVQVGTYGRAEYVEDEISRIGTGYPLAIQNIGTDTNPMFRILLGPLNQGESGAMLQRFKSIGYADAFVRRQ